MTQPSPLLAGEVSAVLRQQSVPMAVGVVFMIGASVIETFWASRLSGDALAAMSFAFPIVGVLMSVSLALMVGTSVVVARTLGQGDRAGADRMGMHALLLGLAVMGAASALGALTIAPLFGLLGASPALVEALTPYMRVQYASAPVLVVLMMANGLLRAHGDARTPRDVMVGAALVDLALAPLLIFGLGPLPALGLTGAALAVAASRAAGLALSARVIRRAGLIAVHLPSRAELAASWLRLLRVTVPVTVTNVLAPLASALFTAVVATQGQAAVAGYGIGSRLEGLFLIAPLALSSALSPFVGQNWGAHLNHRVAEGVRKALTFSALWGLGGAAALFLAAPAVAGAFTTDEDIRQTATLYLRVVPLGYAAQGVVMMVNATFNAMDHAIRSTWLSALRSVVIAVPAAWLGAQAAGLGGIYAGLVLGAVVSALTGWRWLSTLLDPAAEPEAERARRAADDAAFLLANTPEAERRSMGALIEALTELPGVSARRVRWDAVGFFKGARQLGHIHPSGHLDLPLPMELGEALVACGLARHHRLWEDNGWFSFPLAEPGQLAHAEWLLRLSHALALLREQGADTDLIQSELDGLTLTPALREAVQTAAARWA